MNIKEIFYKIESFFLMEKSTANKANVYVGDDILIGKVTIEYCRLFKSYRINKNIEKEIHCKIKDMCGSYITLLSPNAPFIFVEKRGWKYLARIELYCNKHDTELLCGRIAKSKLI